MKSKRMLAVAMAGLLVMSFAGESLARGGGGRGGGGQGTGQCNLTRTQTQSQSQSRVQTRTPADSSQTRPADSRRRDGTFQSTGVTANGSTSRPGNGYGLQDGSGLNSAPATTE